LQAKERALAEKAAELAAAQEKIEALQDDITNKSNLLKGISQASRRGGVVNAVCSAHVGLWAIS